jgi:hypothetical protein
MAINTIGGLGRELAEVEARAIEEEGRTVRGIGRAVSEATGGALRSAEVLQQREIDKQKQKDAEALLASGVQGVSQYAQELGFEDSTVYTRMAQSVKSPNELVNIYGLMRTKADKDISDKNRMVVLGTAADSIRDLRANPKATREDYEKLASEMGTAELGADKDTALQINRTKDDLLKEADRKFGDSAKREQKTALASSKQRQKDEAAVEKAMRTTILGGRGGQKVFGNAINKVSGIMDGLDTIKGIEEGEFKGTQQIAAELGSILAQVLAPGGGSTEKDRENLTPQSLGGTIDDTIQYISGNPQDAVSKDLMMQLKHMLERERKFWNNRLKENNAQMYFTVKPVLERKGVDGKFVNSDLARNWADLMETLAERGEFDKPVTREALGDVSRESRAVTKDSESIATQPKADISPKEFQDELNNLFPE